MTVLVLRILLAVQLAWVALYTARDILRNKTHLLAGRDRYAINAAIGFGTDFLDTLGIGSFATTIFAFKMTGALMKDHRGRDRDDLVPGTLNIGHCAPVIVEALLFMDFVEVEPNTLVSMLAAACLGGWLGAGWVSRWRANTVRVALALCLLATAAVVMLRQLGIGPYSGANEALLGLKGGKLLIAAAANFLLGMLMNLGFGLYAPCMGVLLALGMDVGAVFPIMMGSTAIMMPFSATVFIREGRYDPKATIMLGLFGTLGVLAAYFLVRSANITYVLYIVVGIMIYTGLRYLREGISGAE